MPGCKTIKYVDDTTIYHVAKDPKDTSLQVSINNALSWSSANSMNIHPTKTKEMLICFAKNPPIIPHICINGTPVDRVDNCKLLGVILNNKLTWGEHVDMLIKKANSKLYFLTQLRRTKIDSKEIVKVFCAIVRPVLEYACQLWHGGLTETQCQALESIQIRALKIAYPAITYQEALAETQLKTLQDRRNELCKRLFVSSQAPPHKLFPLLPPPKDTPYDQRKCLDFALPKWCTKRYKNSFIPYCLFNFN